MCLPPDLRADANGAAAEGLRRRGGPAPLEAELEDKKGWLAKLPALPRFNPEQYHFPVDKRLNLMFEDLPGVQLTPLYLLELPLLVYLAHAYRADFRTWMLKPMVGLYLFRECFGMSMSLHRYFSHKGWQCGRVAQFALWWIGCMASQGPPLWWASKHRRHHGKCDTHEDPHSPVQFNPFYAWVGWTYLPGAEGPFGRGIDEPYIREFLKYPELVYGETFHMVPVLVTHGILYKMGGMPYAVYISMLSGIVCQLATMYFNVAFHTPEGGGSHEPDGECHARDIPLDPLSNIFGEAYHAWHHIHPRAHYRPGLDLPYYLGIKPMLMLGVFWGPNLVGKKETPVESLSEALAKAWGNCTWANFKAAWPSWLTPAFYYRLVVRSTKVDKSQ